MSAAKFPWPLRFVPDHHGYNRALEHLRNLDERRKRGEKISSAVQEAYENIAISAVVDALADGCKAMFVEDATPRNTA